MSKSSWAIALGMRMTALGMRITALGMRMDDDLK
jgi:hypothetical protein